MSDVFGYGDELASNELAVNFTWNSGSYSGVRGGQMDSKTLDVGGYAAELDLVIVAATAQFPSANPAPEQAVTVAGSTHRIKSVTTAPDGSFVVLGLKDESKGV